MPRDPLDAFAIHADVQLSRVDSPATCPDLQCRANARREPCEHFRAMVEHWNDYPRPTSPTRGLRLVLQGYLTDASLRSRAWVFQIPVRNRREVETP